MQFRNAGEALVQKLGETLATGRLVTVRGSKTYELTHQHIAITAPLERATVVQGRHGDIFASIAETLWVLAGRDDLHFIRSYLPRAADFSDDGVTWRGGYGPRLRNWSGVDQIRAVHDLLVEDPTSRRAVMTLFDPKTDYLPTKDVPCTNWLQAELRDGKVNLSVAMRSNDLIWGFSGINAFEWSVLLEMLAYWLKADVGELHFYVGSLHVYTRHTQRARKIVRGPGVVSNPSGPKSKFGTALKDLNSELDAWFELEKRVRSGDLSLSLSSFPVTDPLLLDFAWMINAHWTFTRHGYAAGVSALEAVADVALRNAGLEVFRWRTGKSNAPVDPIVGRDLQAAIISLHRTKDSAYGDSWKRRGERGSILPNIARKIDRFRKYTPEKVDPADETWFDTAVDLLVYAIKYKCFLLDKAQAPPPDGSDRWSDGTPGFESLLLETFSSAKHCKTDPVILIANANRIVDALELAYDSRVTTHRRASLVDELIVTSKELVLIIANASLWRTTKTLQRWSDYMPQES